MSSSMVSVSLPEAVFGGEVGIDYRDFIVYPEGRLSDIIKRLVGFRFKTAMVEMFVLESDEERSDIDPSSMPLVGGKTSISFRMLSYIKGADPVYEMNVPNDCEWTPRDYGRITCSHRYFFFRKIDAEPLGDVDYYVDKSVNES